MKKIMYFSPKNEDLGGGELTAEELAALEAQKNANELEELETLVSDATYWPFKDEGAIKGTPVFIGYYVKPFLARTEFGEGEDRRKIGDLLGYIFVDDNGKEHIIGNSYNVEEAFKLGIEPGQKLRIEFRGETKNAKGKPVNIFLVQRYKKK